MISLSYELCYCVKELLAFLHEKKYMTTREREHFRTLYASMHFFSQVIGNTLIFLPVHNKSWEV